MSSKKVLTVLGRLPLLFVIDSISKGTFLNFTFDFFGVGETLQVPLAVDNEGPTIQAIFLSIFIALLQLCVAVMALVLVFCPISSVLECYGCIVGAILTWLSYNCNKKYVNWSPKIELETQNSNLTDAAFSQQTSPSMFLRAAVSLFTQVIIMFGFHQICVTGILHKKKAIMMKNLHYPVYIVLFVSFSFPILLSAIWTSTSVVHIISPLLSATLPTVILLQYCYMVFTGILYDFVLPGVMYMKTGVRELGLDGLIMQFMENASVAWLLRFFFVAQVLCQVVTSKTLEESSQLTNLDNIKPLTLEILHNMCGTLISIMSFASIISIISGMCLSCVYKAIQGNEEDEGLQPVISGFLFVLLAMQTGITSLSGDARLQLLFQNSILLVVANQHFVQNVAGDLLIKASLDESTVGKHIRPLLPFFFFFTFPYFVVLPLWDYPFRLSWLLSITAFSIELIIKSLTTLFVYVINMFHVHTDFLGENTDVILFYTQAICGCLEFICGIFLFVNGAYIFFFELGGFIRLFMMSVHFYGNIYQRAIKGWASYKLRISSLEKVDRLRAATQEELDDKELCSICYQDMNEAVVLDCRHIFHKNCLQKWLSIQDACPLCHEKLKSLASEQQKHVKQD